MGTIFESRRATVSCKSLFPSSSNNNDYRSNGSRRNSNNNMNTRRYHTSGTRTFINTNRQMNEDDSSNTTTVFHIPFCAEQLFDKETIPLSNDKFIRTSLNPLSPAFHSKRHLTLPQTTTISNSSDIKSMPNSETSDYGSGTDPEQHTQHSSPLIDSSLLFNFDPDVISTSSLPLTISDVNNYTPPTRRISSSSSSSSSSTSPSSSSSNLSLLSSSSETRPTNCLSTRSTKKSSLTNSSNNYSVRRTYENNSNNGQCSCDKENVSKRRQTFVQPQFNRNRSTTNPFYRRLSMSWCENCETKRVKSNHRSKYLSNRQRKQQQQSMRSSNIQNETLPNGLSPVKFSVDLTGQNVRCTVEYHSSNPKHLLSAKPKHISEIFAAHCSCQKSNRTGVLPFYNYLPYSSNTRCKCAPINEWSPGVFMKTTDSYEYEDTDDVYHLDSNAKCFEPAKFYQTSPILFYHHDLLLTSALRVPSSTLYLDDSSIVEAYEHPSAQALPYYLRRVTPVIEREFIQPPPTRSWLRLASPNTTQPTAIFTVMNYNILCDKYATRHVYGYCPSWALKWDYRRKQILDELRSYAADIIALQEIETDQFHLFFLPELQKNGYDGVFSPKSRAKTMCEQDRRFVDGCAIFYRQSKFRLVKDYLVEFNQLAMSAANGPSCHDMMNRVMTKDNIGLVALLETKEEIYSHTFSNGVVPSEHKQMLFVCTAHIHWDPEYCDVKVVQTLMLLSELKTIMEDAIQKHRPNSLITNDCSSVPLVLCGDFNSLPDSGVIELMRNGRISLNHADFKELRYESYLQKISRADMNPPSQSSSTDINHHFKLQSAYETTSSPIMPYTNYTYDFKGIIDYVFFSSQLMRVLGVLGPLDPEWMQTNKIVGCPHPNVPSDHFSLLVEFELNPQTLEHSSSSLSSSPIPTNSTNSKISTTPITTRRQI